MAALPGAQDPWGAESGPYLVVGLDVSHQDGQVLNAEVHVVVHVLVDALISRPGVSRGRNARMEMVSPSTDRTSLPSAGQSSPSLGECGAITRVAPVKP